MTNVQESNCNFYEADKQHQSALEMDLNGNTDSASLTDNNLKTENASDSQKPRGLVVLTSSNLNQDSSNGITFSADKVRKPRRSPNEIIIDKLAGLPLTPSVKTTLKVRKPRRKSTKTDKLIRNFQKLRVTAPKRGRKPRGPSKPKAPGKPRAPRRKSLSIDTLCKHFGKLRVDEAKIKKRRVPRKTKSAQMETKFQTKKTVTTWRTPREFISYWFGPHVPEMKKFEQLEMLP